MQFAHVGLTVSNLSRSTRFYQKAFGFEPFFDVARTEPWIGDITGYRGAHLLFQHMRLPSGMHLELIQYQAPAPEERTSSELHVIGNAHFCLYVDDCQKAMEQAVRAGAWVVSRKHPSVIATGPNIGAKVVFLRDPDGISIELFEKASK